MPRPDSFSITVFPVPEKGGGATTRQQPTRPPPSTTTNRRRNSSASPSRELQLLAGHCPSEILDRTALSIIDYAYTALLEIAPPEGGLSVVEVSAPVDPADPLSPPVHVDASFAHCRIRLPYSRPSLFAGRVEQIMNNQAGPPSPSRASVSVSPAAVHLQAGGGGGGGAGDPKVRWRFVDASQPAADASSSSSSSSEALLRVLRTIGSLLEAAISRETTLLEMVRASGFGMSPKAAGIVAVRSALKEMRRVLDVDAAIIAHRRRQNQKRCRRVQMAADAEMLSNTMRRLRVDEVQDDAEVLAKRMRTLRV